MGLVDPVLIILRLVAGRVHELFLEKYSSRRDINLANLVEEEGTGQLIRGCPLREAVETRGAGPSGPRLPLRRPGVGTRVWAVAGPAGSG